MPIKVRVLKLIVEILEHVSTCEPSPIYEVLETLSWTQENAYSKRLSGFEVIYKCFYETQNHSPYIH